MSSISRFWFLRKGTGAVYGPVAEETLQAWAKDGRVAPEDYISTDQVSWLPPFELSSLEMVWFIELPDGLEYGPAHRDALEGLVADGSLPPPVRLRHAVTGERIVLGAEAGAPEAPPPRDPLHNGDTQPIPAAVAPPPVEPPAEPAPSETPPETRAPAPAEAPPPTPPPSTIEPDRTVGWRAIVHERDRFEREALKWKSLYEQTAARLDEETARCEALRRAAEQERRATDSEHEQLRRRIEDLSAELERATARTRGADAQIIEAYHELVRNYDVLAAQITAKEDTERHLREEIAALRAEHESALATAAERSRRERELAEHAHRRLDELERAHVELVRSYRELNDRYIRLRDSLTTPPAPAAPGPSADATPPPEAPSGGSSRLKLWR